MPSLAELRESKGLSREELADAAGVSPQMVERIERGEAGTVPARTLQGVAATLGVDPSEVQEFRPALGLTAVGETGSGEGALTGSSGAGQGQAGEPGGAMTGYERAREG